MRRRGNYTNVNVDGDRPGVQRCTRCGCWLSLDRFGKDVTKPGGRQSRCKKCNVSSAELAAHELRFAAAADEAETTRRLAGIRETACATPGCNGDGKWTRADGRRVCTTCLKASVSARRQA